MDGTLRPAWLIEAGVYGAEAEPLAAEVRRQGMTTEVVPFTALTKDAALVSGDRRLGDGDCVIGYGTFPFARQIQLHRGWVPGAWCNQENLNCTSWFAHFGKYLLNQDYLVMPGVEAIRQQDWIYHVLGRDGQVFVRPAGCQKLFTGRCVAKAGFATALAPTRYDTATLVVVSSPSALGREWRLVIAEDRVIAASQYCDQGRKALARGCPDEVVAFAEAALTDVSWRPDPVFMMDLCESRGALWLVELSAFSTSWLYECDLALVVPTVSDVARAAWRHQPRTDAPRPPAEVPTSAG